MLHILSKSCKGYTVKNNLKSGHKNDKNTISVSKLYATCCTFAKHLKNNFKTKFS
jgi:hypothetical protein